MKRRKHRREQMLAHCDEVSADDGSAYEFFRQSRSPRPKAHHKTHQLCKQVAQTLEWALAEVGQDPWRHRLRVAAVTPAPDASRLLVTLTLEVGQPGAADEERLDLGAIQEHLAQRQGRLREEIAAAITRRKTPTLCFVVLPTSPSKSDEEGEK